VPQKSRKIGRCCFSCCSRFGQTIACKRVARKARDFVGLRLRDVEMAPSSVMTRVGKGITALRLL